MPNHVTNVLKFDCSEERFLEIANFLRMEGEPLGSVDFNKLIPMPKELDIESGSRGMNGLKLYREYISAVNQGAAPMDEVNRTAMEEFYKSQADPEIWALGKAYYENLQNHGATTWYEWCWEHWGTKWNAYAYNEIDPSNKTLIFCTAWSPVPKLIEALSVEFGDVDILYRWADEDLGQNVGEAMYQEGDIIWDATPEYGSKEAIEMAAEILGADVADWGLRLSADGSAYEYFDPDDEAIEAATVGFDEER